MHHRFSILFLRMASMIRSIEIGCFFKIDDILLLNNLCYICCALFVNLVDWIVLLLYYYLRQKPEFDDHASDSSRS